jgi:hypothetical protein
MQRPTYRYGITVLKITAFVILIGGILASLIFLNEHENPYRVWIGVVSFISSIVSFGFFITICSIAESLLFIAHKKQG